uniref:hypothetical protein n=1 Tax=Sphingomonas sp. TaxID=28214 RepID=UPI003B3B0141
MTRPYVLNRFFETTLIVAPAPSLGDTAIEALAVGDSLRQDETVRALARFGVGLAETHTRDIGQPAQSRYRWEWSAAVEQAGGHDAPGAFWSLLCAASDVPVTFV